MSSTPRADLPPMLRSYLEYKDRYPDALLFFQVGDFYELFFNDAKVVAASLNLTLTSRDRNNPDPVPMCGVPIAVIDGYLERLLAKGFSVAIVSQVGESDGRKGMVDRKLERIVTPGVRVLSGAGAAESENIVAAVGHSGQGDFSIAFTSIESGVLRLIQGVNEEELSSKIIEVDPREIILPNRIGEESLDRRSRLVRELEKRSSGGAVIKFRASVAQARFEPALESIAQFNSLSVASKNALQLLYLFLQEVTVGREIKFGSIALRNPEDLLLIDPSSRTHLELAANMRDGGAFGTLLSSIDFTSSASGKRKLRNWVLAPLRSVPVIVERQKAVEWFTELPELVEKLKFELARTADIERISTRIELGAVTPRELGELQSSLESVSRLIEILSDRSGFGDVLGQPQLLGQLINGIVPPSGCAEMLAAKLADSPPLSINQGGIFKAGFNAEIDRLRELKSSGRSQIAAFEAAERERTKISSLKVKFNNVFGYFIEVTKANLDKVPSDYIAKSLTANGQRFITPELKKWEEDLTGAEGKLVALEKKLFEELRNEVLQFVSALRIVAASAAELDALLSLSDYAVREECVKPELTTDKVLEIEEGRHPVLSRIMQREFVPNSLDIGVDSGEVAVITGPNMGGKSTYLKQAALLVVLAQIGSFIPAKRARIGIVDRLFTRIGASDSLLEGESTFMVEMREMAYILRQATESSLLLIDEIGRGTSTVDGMALAQSILESLLSELKARTLFATHFHHLTTLSDSQSNLINLSVGSVDRDGDLFFTHEIKPGAASRSYGLHVAKLAGIPFEILNRAEELIETASHDPGEGTQLSMFAKGEPTPIRKRVRLEPKESAEPADYKQLLAIKSKLQRVRSEHTTPFEALQLIHEIQRELRHECDGKQDKQSDTKVDEASNI